MVTTRKAIKKAEELRISQIGDFKGRLGGVIELPSGIVVRVANPGGIKAFLNADSGIPNSLMGIIQDQLNGAGKQLSAEELVVKNGEVDMEMIEDMMKLMDVIALKVIVDPVIWPNPTEEDLVEWNAQNPNQQFNSLDHYIQDHPSRVFVKELPDDDKTFLFQWISGGTRDLEKFRKELDERMAPVSAVAKSGDSAKSDDGTDAR